MNTRIIEKWIDQAGVQGTSKLAAASEVSAGTIRQILKKDHEPTLEVLRKLGRAMGVTLTELIDEQDHSRAV